MAEGQIYHKWRWLRPMEVLWSGPSCLKFLLCCRLLDSMQVTYTLRTSVSSSVKGADSHSSAVAGGVPR